MESLAEHRSWKDIIDMSHPNFTNGASLEDCYTNFFALADLCGIKWRRLTIPENYLSTAGDPLDDPVLSSYHKCLNAELLSVWRRVVSRSTGNDPSVASATTGVSSRNCGDGSQLLYNKELWIFWYGEEPDLSKFISNELTEIEQGSWENGLSYECRTLLFKAFHNRIERCLLSRGFARLGRWFVQPFESCSMQDKGFTSSISSDPNSSGASAEGSSQLSFAFTFFVHGESTVCASVDVRHLPPVHKLSRQHLLAAQQSSSGVYVIISPYGMAGVITGQAFKDCDPSVQRLLTEWEKFYPISNDKSNQAERQATPSFTVDCDKDAKANSSIVMPSVVEVNIAGVKMKYPSSYIYIVPEMSKKKSSDSAKIKRKEMIPEKETLPQHQQQASRAVHHANSNLLVNLLTPPSTPPQLLLSREHYPPCRTPILSPRQPQVPPSSYCIRSNAFQEMNVVSHNQNKSIENSSAPEDSSHDQSASTHLENSQPPLSAPLLSSNNSQPTTSQISASASTSLSTSNNPSSSIPSSSFLPNQNASEECMRAVEIWGFCDPSAKTPCSCHRCKARKATNSPSSVTYKSTGTSSLSSLSSGGMSNKKFDKFDKHSQKLVAKSVHPFHRRMIVVPDENNQSQQRDVNPASNPESAKDFSLNNSQTSIATPQPKTPSYPYKSPLGIGGLPSLTSNVTTPGGIDSPHSVAPVASIEGPASSSNALDASLSSISPMPSSKDEPISNPSDNLSNGIAVENHKPVADSVTRTDQNGDGSPAKNRWNPAENGTNGSALSESEAHNSARSSTHNGGIKRPHLPVDSTAGADIDSVFSKKLLYDFSSVDSFCNNWDLPAPKNRRTIKGLSRLEDLDDRMDIDGLKPKDPYEFSEFDEELGQYKSEVTKESENKAEKVTSNSSTSEISSNNFSHVQNSQNEQNVSKDSSKSSVFAVLERGLVSSPKVQKVFTRVEELTVTPCDLNKIFSSDDEESSGGFSTPNAPNSSTKTQGVPAAAITSNQIAAIEEPSKSRNNSSNVLAELTRIFPTPPSMEHNTAPSPCNTFTNQDMTLIDDINARDKLDAYPCSPLSFENSNDWSYVYKPPVQCKFITSTKYAPLPDIPSLPQIQLPPECVYKHKEPSSPFQTVRDQRQSKQQQNSFHNQPVGERNLHYSHHVAIFQQGPSPIPYSSQMGRVNKSSGYSQQYANGHNSSSHTPNHHSSMISNSHQISQLRQHHSPQQNVPMNRLGPGPFSPSVPMHHPGINASSIRVMRPLGNVRPAFPNHQVPMMSPQNAGNMYINNQFPNPYNDRNQIPANSSCTPHFSSLVDPSNSSHPSTNMYHPYPQVSGSNSPLPGHPHQASAIGNIPGLNSMPYDLHHHQTPLMAGRNTMTASGPSGTSVPDAQCILINLILSDSMLNLFKDHNFESCTLCACNGNIKGSDVGVYLPDFLLPSGSDEPQYKCTCGFSAVSNRHRGYFAGLFYEDEIEITGVAYDPVERLEKKSLFKALKSEQNDDVMNKDNVDLSSTNSSDDQLDSSLVDLLRSQCSTLFPSSSLLAKAILFDCIKKGEDFDVDPNSVPILLNSVKVLTKKAFFVRSNALQRSDGCEVTYSALIATKQAMNGILPKIVLQNLSSPERLVRKASCLHEWSFENGVVPANNQEVVRFLRSITLLLQESVRRKPQAMWEATYSVSGPLTWRQFHRLAGRGTEDQCEPQPIPSLLVGHDNDWVALSPFALKFWEKLMLEPYSVQRDVAYVVIAPGDAYILSHVKTYFKELSATYEMLRLGKHSPLVKITADGILKVGNKDSKNEPIDEWFNKIGDSDLATKIKLYAKVCRHSLAPHLRLQSFDKSLFDNRPSRADHNHTNAMSSSDKLMGSPHHDGPMNDPKPNEENVECNAAQTAFLNSQSDSTEQEDDPTKQPVIVIYMVEPFTFANMDENVYRLSCLGLLRSYVHMLTFIPEHLHSSINLQLVSLDAVLNNREDFLGAKRQDQLKALAFSVFNQCRKILVHQSTSKSLTGFGPAASLEMFLKSKDPNLTMTRIYTPPYILAPLKDKQTELGEMFGDRREKSQILYCAYCLTEDQKWLVVTCSNEKGDLLESTLINIEIPKRTRRRKASVKKFGLRKVLEFIFSVMTETVQPWRLVIGRLGRVGHGELREWVSLLSKKSLVKYSRMLRDKCRQCSIMSPYETPCILSACLISLEADTALRVFPDHFTPDDRFNSSSSSCHLSTPEEASCTHILVFPTSAASSSSQASFPADGIGINENDLLEALGADGEAEDLGVDDGMDIFGEWPESPTASSRDQSLNHPDSPMRQSGFDLNIKNSIGIGGDYMDDPTNLLQQPLALGYYVSTAQTGPLPKWFWSSCPHHSDLNPVFLKSALLIHTPSVQQNNDDFNLSNRNCHPLDSNLTTDVLRYVLEGYNSLSWISLDPATHDRMSCLPIHIQILMQLYHTVQALV